MKFSRYILIFCLFTTIAQAQDSLDLQVPQFTGFAQEVYDLMSLTRNSDAMEVGLSFAELWESGSFNSDQKDQIQSLHARMREKKFPARPYLQRFYSMLISASEIEQIPSGKLSELLDVCEQVLENHTSKQYYYWIKTADEFLAHRALYYGKQNKLYYQGGSFSFRYEEPVNPEPVLFIEEPVEEEPEEIIEEITDSNQDSWGDDDWGDDGWGDDGWSDESTNDDGGWGEEEQSSGDSGWDSEPVQPVLDPVENEAALIESLTSEIILPALDGPIIDLENTSLLITTNFDSTEISNTSGGLNVLSRQFVGEGGKLTWEMTGLPAEDVFVTFNKYSFAVNSPRITSEDAVLTHKENLTEPVRGVFEFESLRKPGEYIRFPRFKSYSSNIEVKNLGGDELEYTGGFSMEGAKISSSSVLPGWATIEGVKNAKRFVANSKRFVLSDSLITSEHTRFTMYHERDSLYHPSVRFKYETDSNRVVLLKENGIFKNTPYRSSYFNTDIKAEYVNWNMNADSLDLAILNARLQTPAIVESIDYFNRRRYNSLIALYEFHPLLVVVGYARKTGQSSFYLTDLTNYLKKQNPNTVKNAVVSLMQNEFIDFDYDTQLITLKRKAYHYILSEKKQKDYDNLLITSISPTKPNITINFSKEEMTIRGIEKFYISRELNVFIQPDSSEIVLLRDRDFYFTGLLTAGNFEYRGEEMRFNYDSFLVDMPKINTISFNTAKDELERRNGNTEQMGSQLSETAGILYINKPNNKSARKFYPQYPMFNANKGALVYFDSDEVLEGAYDKSMYFEIPPFNVDSVSSSDPRSISFRGVFSSGIFPDFEETLYMLPNGSLGFEHKSPPGGYQLYDGMGVLHSELIKLDEDGLRSQGTIEYLSSTLDSDDFVFYPDSVITQGTNFVIDPGTLSGASFPDASVESFEMKWLPKQDTMMITTIEDSINLYSNTAEFSGTAMLSPSGMSGDGNLVTRGSGTQSEEFTFTETGIGARHAGFDIKSDKPEKPALAGEDVKIDFDLAQNTAMISPEVEGVAAISFPYAQLNTSITNATWDLAEREVRMSKDPDVLIENSYFYTTRPELDSLVFNATDAVYDMDSLTLKISGIPYIIVADARITPENNEVVFLENAELNELHNASLVMDTLNDYHNLYDGNIKIVSRTHFEGDATYQFVNAVQDTFSIKFGEFELEEEGDKRSGYTQHTVASGPVSDLDNFVVSPGFVFQGNVKMFANREVLELDGYVRINSEIDFENTEWIKYQSAADVQEIIIDFDGDVTESGSRINAGLHFESGTNALYHTFSSELITPGDVDFFTPHGELRFDPEKSDYFVAVKSKTDGETYSGEIFRYNEQSGEIVFEGPVNFLTREPNISINAAARGKGSLNKNEFLLNGFLVFDFDMPSGAMDMMARNISEVAETLSLSEATGDLTSLLYKASEIMGERQARAYEEQSLDAYVPLVSMSGELTKDLVISDVNMKWSEVDKAWYSVGKLGVSNAGRTDINAALDGYIEIRKDVTGDIINIFIQASPNTWYYLGYQDNRVLTYSSNAEYNALINKKSNVSKAKIGDLIYAPSDLDETLLFINDFREIYLGITEPYDLSDPQEVPDSISEGGDEGGEFELYDEPAEEEEEEEEDEDDDDEGF